MGAVNAVKGIMNDAKTAFLRELSRYTLADVVQQPKAILAALKTENASVN